MQVWNVLHADRWKYRTQLSGYTFATKAYIDNRKKLLNRNISSTCPHNMVGRSSPYCENVWRRRYFFELRSVGKLGAPQQISTFTLSCVLLYWQRYCTELEQWVSAKLCGVVWGIISPDRAEAPVRWGEKIKYLLIAHFLNNNDAKIYCMRPAIAQQRRYCNVRPIHRRTATWRENRV